MNLVCALHSYTPIATSTLLPVFLFPGALALGRRDPEAVVGLIEGDGSTFRILEGAVAGSGEAAALLI